ncbi:hypothetical protein D8I24_3254 (plasmid) [Cupriavidus necator H850]|nr:hypothetical protein D8I24_3254 [Cupriavidus necator H850]
MWSHFAGPAEFTPAVGSQKMPLHFSVIGKVRCSSSWWAG